jgi:catechol 2,3-dioxygenase-like lactoylglutathione lyase family enzyme
MITNVSLVSVYVTDQDLAKAFYTEKLGFVEQADIQMGDGYRWLAVHHPDHPELVVNLAVPGPPHDPEYVDAMKAALAKGQHGGLGLSVDDCRATVEDLRAKGVEIIQEPADRPYGTEALIRDDCGNWLVLVERQELDLDAMPEDWVVQSS